MTPHVSGASVVLPFLVLLAFPLDISAQPADTLDPGGYFPLAVGNLWEYEHAMYRPFTSDTNRTQFELYEIIGEIAVHDTVYYDLLFEWHDENGSLIARDTSRLRYDSTTASIRGENLPQIIEWLQCLDEPEEPRDNGTACWVTAYREQEQAFGETFEVSRFSNFVWGFTAGYGIGILDGGGGCEPCSLFDSHDAWFLRYARIGDREYGASIVHTEPAVPLPADRLHVYPNPTNAAVIVEAPGRGVLTVHDLLGRSVRQVDVRRHEAIRMDLGDLPAGMYLLRFKGLTRLVVLQ